VKVRACFSLLTFAVLASSAQCFAQSSFTTHGPRNAITDVDGIWVGSEGRTDPPYRTGLTLVWTREGAMGSVYVPGGWPGSLNYVVLQPGKREQLLNAVLLTGGSFLGLRAFSGAFEWLEEKGYASNPLVAGAVVFDLGRGGDVWARPAPDWARTAMQNSSRGEVKQGNVGAGTGTHTGSGIPLKGGLGTASVVAAQGITVGALVITNAVGTPVNFTDCSLFGAVYEVANEFSAYGYRTPSFEECVKVRPQPSNPLPPAPWSAPADPEVAGHPNTTIGVVATNAALSREQAQRVARAANEGHSRAINPINHINDGDSMFVMSTTVGAAPVSEEQLQVILRATREVWARAVVHATLNAESYTHPVTGVTRKSYCDTFPTACSKRLVTK
jgi:putative pantetheine hydrolase